MFLWKNGTFSASGSLSKGLGRNEHTTAFCINNVVWALGGRCARWLITGRMSRMLIFQAHRSPFQPTTSNGLKG